MKISIAYRALAVAAFGLMSFGSIATAEAATDADIRELKALLQQQQKRIQQLEAQSGKVKHRDPKGTGMGIIGTGTSGSRTPAEREAMAPPASAGPGTTGRYEGGSAPDPMASLQHWYDRLSIRGYTQMRYNDILSGGPNYNDISTYNDKSVSSRANNFFVRRARVIISGDVSDRMYIYTQFDLASSPSGTFTNAPTGAASNAAQNSIYYFYNPGTAALAPYGPNQVGTYARNSGNFAQIRDLYADIYFDENKEFRARPGYSKIPYGYENMQ